MKLDSLAKETWGSNYDKIPKSVFAYIAWHLANASSDVEVAGGAEKRFFHEWDCLLAHGLQKPVSGVKR